MDICRSHYCGLCVCDGKHVKNIKKDKCHYEDNLKVRFAFAVDYATVPGTVTPPSEHGN